MKPHCYAVIPVGLALLCSCRQDTSPEPAVTANRIREPAEPLAAAVKAVPAGKVRVELVRSQPSGAAGDKAEYQWALLIPLSPEDMTKALLGLATPREAGWSVVRLTLRVGYDKRNENVAITKEGTVPKPGARHMELTTEMAAVFYYPGASSGTSSASGHVKPGAVLTLERSGPSGGSLKGGLAPLTRRQDLLEVGPAAFDDLVVPVFKAPATVDVPTTLELLRIGDTTTRLAINP